MHKLLENINGWVQDGPMGNDKQVNPYLAFAKWAVPTAVSAYGAWKGAQDPETDIISPEDIKQRLRPIQGNINQMQAGYGRMMGIGKDLMDPTSGVNQQQYQMMNEQGQNQMALQNLLARRQAAATGQASGITSAQSTAATGQTARNLGQQYQQGLQQNRQAGIGVLGQAQGLLGNIGRMQTGLSENIAQSAISQNQKQREQELRHNQMIAEGASGLGSGLLQAWGSGSDATPSNTGISPTDEQLNTQYLTQEMIDAGWMFKDGKITQIIARI